MSRWPGSIPLELRRCANHPDRSVHAREFCRTCYSRFITAKPAECHPRRIHVAKGLCKECYQSLPDSKERAIWARRLKKYGLDREWYERLWEEQRGLCSICDRQADAVDHSHVTGKVRGLLCKKCNTGIGWFEDRPELFARAKAYLEKYS